MMKILCLLLILGVYHVSAESICSLCDKNELIILNAEYNGYIATKAIDACNYNMFEGFEVLMNKRTVLGLHAMFDEEKSSMPLDCVDEKDITISYSEKSVQEVEYVRESVNAAPSNEAGTPGKKAEKEPQKSWFIKYWYIILPVGLFLVFGMGGAAPPAK
eukprot:TRINITY_DN774053_c0_g1_i1.p1 TRINITY_DN774053_c0_g1~~TRINITY_DN774053_c0_g1_i1.p1  ORF type:complete len:160 (-),score=38.91 TRINITY_DN774053_c0_g1_i1:181-660(-)